MGIMLLLAIIGGVVYVYLSGRSPAPKKATPNLESIDSTPLKAPTQQPVDSVVGASIQFLTTPVKAGENATVNVHTNTKADCTISVIYAKTPAVDSGLIKKQADAYGSVSWTWTVATDAPAGSWPVKVTCANTKKSAVVEGNMVVTK